MNICQHLKLLREKLDLNQEEFAKKIGSTKRAVGSWEQGTRSPSSTQRKRICGVFNMSEAELFGAPPAVTQTDIQKVPLISWVRAGKFTEIEDGFPVGIGDEYIYTDVKGKNIFALTVNNDSMVPEFQEGDIIIVNPEASVTSGDYVVIANRDNNTATFKQYKQYGKKVFLHPLNPKYPDIELDHDPKYQIIGKVMQKVKKY
jgi:SOS-response transcriptional repressor LexA